MKKNKIIAKTADTTFVKYDKVREIINAFVEVISDELSNDNEVKIKGLGKFYLSQNKPRTIKSVYDGSMTELGSVNVVRFKPSTKIKDRVNA